MDENVNEIAQVKQALIDFVIRVAAGGDKVHPAEVGILPDVAKIVFNISGFCF